MDFKLKGNILGLNYNFDIDTRLPLQELFQMRLKFRWLSQRIRDTKQSKDFIYYALRHLPNDSYIIFNFGPTDDFFVQFCKAEGSILLDIPLWPGNRYFGKEEDVVQLLRDMHFQRNYSKKDKRLLHQDRFDIQQYAIGKKSIRANFGKIYIRAAVGSLQIAEKVLGMDNPRIYDYESECLLNVNRKRSY